MGRVNTHRRLDYYFRAPSNLKFPLNNKTSFPPTSSFLLLNSLSTLDVRESSQAGPFFPFLHSFISHYAWSELTIFQHCTNSSRDIQKQTTILRHCVYCDEVRVHFFFVPLFYCPCRKAIMPLVRPTEHSAIVISPCLDNGHLSTSSIVHLLPCLSVAGFVWSRTSGIVSNNLAHV